MNNKALLAQFKEWHDNEEHEKIIAAVLALPEECLNPEIMYALTSTYLEIGELKSAVAVLEGLRKTEESTYQWHFRLGTALVITAENDRECEEDDALRRNILERARIHFARGMNLNPPDDMLSQASDFVEQIEEKLGYYDDDEDEENPDDIEMYSLEEVECLEDHIEKYFGEIPTVFHEIKSEDIHVDVYVVPPTEKRNYYTLITLGMGAHEMNVPEEAEGKNRVELLMCLPPDWKVGEDAPEWYWPIGTLKSLAHLPIDCETWLGWGHTVDNGGNMAPNTQLSGSLLVRPEDVEDGADECTLPGGEVVTFLELIPIYREEMDYKIDNDTKELLLKMGDVSHILNPNRHNVCEDYLSHAERFDNLHRHSRKVISKGLPVEPINGCNHIAIFVRWCITHHLLEEGFYKYCSEFAQSVLDRNILDLRPFFIETLGAMLEINQFSFVGANFLIYYYTGVEGRPYYPADVDDYAEKFFGTERYNCEEFQDEAYMFVPYDETYYNGMSEYIQRAFDEFLPNFMDTYSDNLEKAKAKVKDYLGLEAEGVPFENGYYGRCCVPKCSDGSRAKNILVMLTMLEEDDFGSLVNAFNPTLNEVLAVECPSGNPIEWAEQRFERIKDADFGEHEQLYSDYAQQLGQNPMLLQTDEENCILIIRDDDGVNRRYIVKATNN